MLDQNKIKYKQVDLAEINKSQLVETLKQEKKRWNFSIFYNIFNKTLKFNFKWRF